jgi:hypothetical protein
MVSGFPVSSRDVPYQTLPGREKLWLFPSWESLVSDIPAGDGKTANLFLQCIQGRYWSARIDDISLWPPKCNPRGYHLYGNKEWGEASRPEKTPLIYQYIALCVCVSSPKLEGCSDGSVIVYIRACTQQFVVSLFTMNPSGQATPESTSRMKNKVDLFSVQHPPFDSRCI